MMTNSHQNGIIFTKSAFLHNTKVTTSKTNEGKDKEYKRDNFHAQGRDK